MTVAEVMINATVSWFPFGSLYLLFIWTNHSGTFASSKRYKITVTAALVPLMILGLAQAFLPLQNL